MNVLFYLHRYPGYGGIENVTTYLANYLSNNGETISILSFITQAEEHLLPYLKPSIKVYHIDPEQETNQIITSFKELIQKNKIDTIIFQDSYAPIEQYLIPIIEKGNIRLFTVEHNVPDCAIRALRNDYASRLKWYPSKQWLSYIYRLSIIRLNSIKRHKELYSISDKYILLSENFIPVLRKMIGKVNTSKVLFINNPITIKPQIDKSIGKQKICLFCGRLSGQKGLKYLIRIWEEIERIGTEWQLVIVGDGPLKEYISSSIKEKNLKNIFLEGFQEDPSPYYAKASILCMASIFEGWMLTLVEAMVYGCVPMTFNSYESASDIINDGVNGLLIEPFDVSSYVDKLYNLMNDDNLRLSMAEKAKVNAERFAIDRIGAIWMRLLKTI